MGKNIIRIVITILFLNIFTGSVYAGDYINFENMTIDDGLSQSTAETIFQDSNGYIWIGTNDGLNRYNGSEFKIFKSDKLKNNSLVDNYILTLAEDNEKKLWVGTVNGLSVIDLKDYSIKNYKYYKNNTDKQFNNIHSILIRDDGSILMGTYDGVYLYDKEKDDFNKILGDHGELVSNDVEWMEEDNNKNIWIGTSKGLNKIDTKNNKIETYENKISNRNFENIELIMCDDNNNLWIGTRNDGLYKLDISTNEISSYVHDEDNENSLPSDHIRALQVDKSGTLWVGTTKGLSKYVGENKFITYENKSYDLNSLAHNLIYTIMEDDSGLLWIGTYTGISIFDPQNKIYLYKNDPLDDNSLSDNVIHGIYEDDEGLIWIGTKDKGLNILDRENDKVSHIYEGDSDKELNSNSVKVITGKDNIIWVGSRNGINKIDKNNMTIEKITEEEGLISNNIKSLFLDSKGYLWVGSAEGLDILNTKNNEIISMTKVLREYGVKEIHIEEIYEDEDGIYWIGDMISSGLIKIDPINNTTKFFNIDNDNDKNSISGIRSIAEDKNNNLWLGTTNGLFKFNKDSEELEYYSEENGLANNTVYSVLLDEDGNLWMSTNNGISRFDLDNENFTTVTSTDGLQSNEFNGKAYCKLKNGDFVFGGVKGLNIFNPKDIVVSSQSPKVTFDTFEVEGKLYNNIDNMKFKYNENFVRIKFFIPEYRKNNNIQYYYKLEGLNDNWIQIKNNEVILNELKSSNYTFKVKARSKNGNIGEENSVNFTIEQPFWRSNGAMLFYTSIIILLIIVSVNKVKRLDRLVSKRTEELRFEMEKNEILFGKLIENERSKNNYFINLSHELRTPLNVISSLEQLITNLNKSEKGIGKDKIEYYMEMMRNNTKRLLNLINNIIDTSKVENGKYKICKEKNDIVYLVEETALSMKNLIESSNIELIIDTNIEEKIINCDKYEIERCLVNLISNAAKFTPDGGRITVDIKDNKDTVIISVEDTGIGIECEYHDSIFDRFNQVVDEKSEVKGGSGLGLTITKHLINLHGGSIYVTSEKNKGSKFIIELPVE